MSVEIPACPDRGGFAIFFDGEGNIKRVFAYKKKKNEKNCLIEIKNPISKDELFKRCENVKLKDWGTEILPVKIECSPYGWAVIDGQRIWVP